MTIKRKYEVEIDDVLPVSLWLLPYMASSN